MVALDFPTINIGLEESVKGKIQIRANQKSGFAIEQLGAITKAVAERFDHQQTKRTITTCFAPKKIFDDFDFEGLQFTGGKRLNLDQGDGVVTQNFFWGWCRRAVTSWAALFDGTGRDGKTEFGIFADAAEQDRVDGS